MIIYVSGIKSTVQPYTGFTGGVQRVPPLASQHYSMCICISTTLAAIRSLMHTHINVDSSLFGWQYSGLLMLVSLLKMSQTP